MLGGGSLYRMVRLLYAKGTAGGPLCREEAINAGRSPVLKGFKEAPVSGGGSLCRMVLLLKLRGLKEAPMLRVGPCAAERRPCAAQRRPLCREEVLCAGRSYVLRELEEAPVSGGGSSDCAEWFDSSMLRELQEAPVPKGSHLCREVPCAERI